MYANKIRKIKCLLRNSFLTEGPETLGPAATGDQMSGMSLVMPSDKSEGLATDRNGKSKYYT
jgi:hypothetical protein